MALICGTIFNSEFYSIYLIDIGLPVIYLFLRNVKLICVFQRIWLQVNCEIYRHSVWFIVSYYPVSVCGILSFQIVAWYYIKVS